MQTVQNGTQNHQQSVYLVKPIWQFLSILNAYFSFKKHFQYALILRHGNKPAAPPLPPL